MTEFIKKKYEYTKILLILFIVTYRIQLSYLNKILIKYSLDSFVYSKALL